VHITNVRVKVDEIGKITAESFKRSNNL